VKLALAPFYDAQFSFMVGVYYI